MRHKSIVTAFIIILLLSAGLIFVKFVNAQPATDATVSGFAWSSNIGWVSFQAPLYQVTLTPSGALTGHAWSSNIGWIRMNPEIDATLPTSVSGRNIPARLDPSTGKIIGWARACSVFPNNTCSGTTMRPLEETGGWDGWISFDSGNVAGSPTYGVSYDSVTGKFSGYAWGATNLGWISFCDEANGYCVKTNDFKIRCEADTDSDGIFGEPSDSQASMGAGGAPANVDWRATVVSGGTPNFTYTWSGDVVGSLIDTSAEYSVERSDDYSSTGTKTVRIHVKDANDKTSEESCSVQVDNPLEKRLTVNITSDGIATGSVNIPGWEPDNICNADINEASVTCPYGGGTSKVYSSDTQVDITAAPGSYDNAGIPTPYSVSWSGDVPSSCTTGLSCDVMVDGPKTVFVNLFKPGLSYLSHISATPPVITINTHSSGQSASSNTSNIRVEALNGALGGQLCLKSIVSELGSHPELSAVTGAGRSPVCHFGEETFNCNATSGLANCIEVESGDTLDIPFYIEVLDRDVAVFDNSPYRAVIGISGVVDNDPPNSDSADANVNVRFFYRVGDVRPR